MYNLIFLIAAMINLPSMLADKSNWYNFMSFGFSIGILFYSLSSDYFGVNR